MFCFRYWWSFSLHPFYDCIVRKQACSGVCTILCRVTYLPLVIEILQRLLFQKHGSVANHCQYACVFPLQSLRDPGTWLQTILDSLSKRWIENAQLDWGGFTSLFNLIFTLYSYHNCATSKNRLGIFLNNTSFSIARTTCASSKACMRLSWFTSKLHICSKIKPGPFQTPIKQHASNIQMASWSNYYKTLTNRHITHCFSSHKNEPLMRPEMPQFGVILFKPCFDVNLEEITVVTIFLPHPRFVH